MDSRTFLVHPATVLHLMSYRMTFSIPFVCWGVAMGPLTSITADDGRSRVSFYEENKEKKTYVRRVRSEKTDEDDAPLRSFVRVRVRVESLSHHECIFFFFFVHLCSCGDLLAGITTCPILPLHKPHERIDEKESRRRKIKLLRTDDAPFVSRSFPSITSSHPSPAWSRRQFCRSGKCPISSGVN